MNEDFLIEQKFGKPQLFSVPEGYFEKLEKDIQDLEEYVRILEEHLKSVKDPLKYKKMKKLDREARLMIHDLKQMKLLMQLVVLAKL